MAAKLMDTRVIDKPCLSETVFNRSRLANPSSKWVGSKAGRYQRASPSVVTSQALWRDDDGRSASHKRAALAAAADRQAAQELLDKPSPASGLKILGSERVPCANEAPRRRAQPRTAPVEAVPAEDLAETTIAVILAGGPSNNALARSRAMPAVPLGSNLKLIDIPLSNCIRSGINKMYVLTQFNSHSLNQHISCSYPPATFGGLYQESFVDVLTATQTVHDKSWYKGSADAVRRNLETLLEPYKGEFVPDDVLVLSGQALYNMDFQKVVGYHRANKADVTIVTTSVDFEDARHRGVCKVSTDNRILQFIEKPTPTQLKELAYCSQYASNSQPFEASTGVYVFKREVLEHLLSGEAFADGNGAGKYHFGHHVLPSAIQEGLKLVSYHNYGFWKDVSSLRDYYEANLAMTLDNPPVKMFDVEAAIQSKGTCLPPVTFNNCDVKQTLVGEGSVLRGARLSRCVLGRNVFIQPGTLIEDSLILGNDTYLDDKSRDVQRAAGQPVVGIGRNCHIRNAIIDENVSIGDNVVIHNAQHIKEADHTDEGYMIQDGLVVVISGAKIPDNFRI